MTKLEQVARSIRDCMLSRHVIVLDDDAADMARAAVEALREPTISVIEAVEDSMYDHLPEPRSWTQQCAKDGWIAGIDAILNEKSAISPGLDAAITDELDHPPADIMKEGK
jgi:hypothetical protein